MGFGNSNQQSQNTSQGTSTASNQAYPALQASLGDQVNMTGKSTNAIANLLGLNGAGGSTQGFDDFRNSSGYDFIRNQGIQGITSSKAAQGLLGSGSTAKAIAGYSSNLASGFLNSYLSNLMGLSNTGLQSGQILAGAGNTSNSQSTSSGTSTGKSTNYSLG